jgi:spore maturation protein CgeB
MKIIFFSSYYDKYLEDFYKNRPLLSKKSSAEQIQTLNSDYFGVYGSYTKYINRLNAETKLIVSNCKPLQQMWAKENGIRFDEKNWKYTIPIEQIKKYRPDIFFMSSMFEYYGAFLDEVRKYVPKIFGWIACPIPSGIRLNQMDLILTSLQQFVDDFRNQGLNSEFLPAAFDPDILREFPTDLERDIEFSFIGSLSKNHLKRIKLVQALLRESPIKLFGTGIKAIPDNRSLIQKIFSKNPILHRYYGEVWGLDMYRTLRRSKITFNAHIDISGNYAGNIRMYEATGTGALLITDGKKAGSKIFSDDEVVYYDSIAEAVEKVKYYLLNQDAREEIAKKGQYATLTKHSFELNAVRMAEYFKEYS